MDKSKLKTLLVDQDSVLEDLILGSLTGVARLDNKTGEMYPVEGYQVLNPEAKICAFLMARKAANILGLIETEAAAPKAIIDRTGMPMGTVNPTLRNLLKKGILSQTPKKEYFLPGHALSIASQKIKGGKNGSGKSD